MEERSKKFMDPFFYFCRGLVRLVLPRRRILHPEYLEDGVVYISRHMDMHGPMTVMADLPLEAHIWAFSVFCDRQSCYKQFHDFTFKVRYHWPEWLCCFAAWLCSGPVVKLMHSMDVIPVYRSQRDILKTLNLSLEKLLAGESLMIFPDIAYDDASTDVGAFYMGYLHLGRSYYKKTGRPLKFVPIYSPLGDKVLDVGEPLMLDPEKSYNEEKERVTQAIQQFFREAAERDEGKARK